MTHSPAQDIISLHDNKVPIIINNNQTDIVLTKNKFIVPRELSIRQFHCILLKYCNTNQKQSIIMFINNTLPNMSDTIGNVYDTCYNKDDSFLYMNVRKENTFG
jgi:GABA(A) receptor-associated protein